MRKLARVIKGMSRRVVTRPAEVWLLLRMAWWVAILSVRARYFSLPGGLEIVAGNRNKVKPSSGSQTQDELARAIDLLLSADVLMFKPSCWKRAAVLHRYLLRNGIPTRIIFGVRNEAGGKVDGHAWLELNGQPILENTPPDYVMTYTFPQSQPQKFTKDIIELEALTK